jgi:predicted DNA-binding ribbon-helix-helix protein
MFDLFWRRLRVMRDRRRRKYQSNLATMTDEERAEQDRLKSMLKIGHCAVNP